MRGFDQVMVDEIAAAADVGRMTVFNHFSRNEDMFFDRDEEGREILREALRECNPGVAPIETLRLLAHRTFRQNRDTEEAKAAFLAIVDKGTIGVKAAMAGTPYT